MWKTHGVNSNNNIDNNKSQSHHKQIQKISTKRIILDTTGKGKWSTGNCAKNFNLTMQTNYICTTEILFWRMICTNCPWDFETNGSHNFGQTNKYRDSHQKKGICQVVDFVVLASHKVKYKESE